MNIITIFNKKTTKDLELMVCWLGGCLFDFAANGCEHEQCGFGANQLSLTTNLVGTTHFHNQKTSIAYACC